MFKISCNEGPTFLFSSSKGITDFLRSSVPFEQFYINYNQLEHGRFIVKDSYCFDCDREDDPAPEISSCVKWIETKPVTLYNARTVCLVSTTIPVNNNGDLSVEYHAFENEHIAREFWSSYCNNDRDMSVCARCSRRRWYWGSLTVESFTPSFAHLFNIKENLQTVPLELVELIADFSSEMMFGQALGCVVGWRDRTPELCACK